MNYIKSGVRNVFDPRARLQQILGFAGRIAEIRIKLFYKSKFAKLEIFFNTLLLWQEQENYNIK